MEIIDSDHYKDLMLLLKIRTGFGSQYLIVFKWLRLFQIFYVLILEFLFYYSSLLLFLILCCDFLLFNSLWAYFPITIKITIIKPLSANSKICFMLQSVSVDCFFSPEWVTFPVSSDAKLFWTVLQTFWIFYCGRWMLLYCSKEYMLTFVVCLFYQVIGLFGLQPETLSAGQQLKH